MPCSPSDLTVTVPNQPSAPAIPGFGSPFAPKLPSFNLPFPSGFPEDLLGLLDSLQFILPSGIMKPGIFPNFTKDIFDGIMSLLDKFFPFLMLYKFFLPVLDLIICIIEVLCALLNPFKLPGKIRRLFRQCIPAFLSLFPIFALIVMLLSLLFLLLALVEYIISEIIKLINLLLKNIKTIVKALSKADQPTILGVIQKIGMIICAFQNLFVVLSIFKIIIDLIKDMVALAFSIPPCDDGNSINADEGCCTPDVCPQFIRNNETIIRTTGKLQYFKRISQDAGLSSVLSGLPAGFLTSDLRKESWQFYDDSASIQEALINITHAYDLPVGDDTVFFPTDATYTETTPPKQVPYTVDMKLFYNPTNWGRIDAKGPRFIKINNCIVKFAPSTTFTNFNNSTSAIANGVLILTGGTAIEFDTGEQIFINNFPANLESFVHMDPIINTSPTFPPVFNDGYTYNNIEYTFHINHEVLLQKALITLGCLPLVALDRTFINTTFAGNAGLNLTLLRDLLNRSNGNVFPDTEAAQNCLETAVAALRSNISEEGVAEFQARTSICLNQLKDDTSIAIGTLLGLGYNPSKSKFTLTPIVQFTTDKIEVKVNINETNGLSLISSLPDSLTSDIINRIVPTFNFGNLSSFRYDGINAFIADLTSDTTGTGTMKMSFDNKAFTTINIPTNLSINPTIDIQSVDYRFIFAPAGNTGSGFVNTVGSGTGNTTGDTDGAPRRDEGDVSDSGSNGGS